MRRLLDSAVGGRHSFVPGGVPPVQRVKSFNRLQLKAIRQALKEMAKRFFITRATTGDVNEVAVMVGELLKEIMTAIGVQAFNFNLDETTARLKGFINREQYFVFVARHDSTNAIGFLTLYESHALYAEGSFGTIPELYVRPEYRSQNVGHHLVLEAKSFGTSRGWKRLEVTTPPLPQFDRTLAFYEQEGFAVTGGRKLKIAL